MKSLISVSLILVALFLFISNAHAAEQCSLIPTNESVLFSTSGWLSVLFTNTFINSGNGKCGLDYQVIHFSRHSIPIAKNNKTLILKQRYAETGKGESIIFYATCKGEYIEICSIKK